MRATSQLSASRAHAARRFDHVDRPAPSAHVAHDRIHQPTAAAALWD
jgi:hypothetical protein